MLLCFSCGLVSCVCIYIHVSHRKTHRCCLNALEKQPCYVGEATAANSDSVWPVFKKKIELKYPHETRSSKYRKQTETFRESCTDQQQKKGKMLSRWFSVQWTRDWGQPASASRPMTVGPKHLVSFQWMKKTIRHFVMKAVNSPLGTLYFQVCSAGIMQPVDLFSELESTI